MVGYKYKGLTLIYLFTGIIEGQTDILDWLVTAQKNLVAMNEIIDLVERNIGPLTALTSFFYSVSVI